MTEKDMESPAGDQMADNEDIIELNDEVIELTEPVPSDDEVIELTEVVAGDGKAVDSAGASDVNKAAGSVAGILPNDAVTPEQIDAAVERAVDKIYGEKIESLLVDIVEKKVAAEIEKVKQMILDGSSGA